MAKKTPPMTIPLDFRLPKIKGGLPNYAIRKRQKLLL